LLGSAAIEGPERREGVLVAEGHDDGRRIDAAGGAADHRRQHPPEPLQRDARGRHPTEPREGHGYDAGALRRGVAEHLEVRGTDADPVVGARGRRGDEEAEKEAKTTANAVGTIGRQGLWPGRLSAFDRYRLLPRPPTSQEILVPLW